MGNTKTPQTKKTISLILPIVMLIISSLTTYSSAAYAASPQIITNKTSYLTQHITLLICVFLLIINYGAIIGVSLYHRTQNIREDKPFHKTIAGEIIWLTIPAIITAGLIVLSVL